MLCIYYKAIIMEIEIDIEAENNFVQSMIRGMQKAIAFANGEDSELTRGGNHPHPRANKRQSYSQKAEHDPSPICQLFRCFAPHRTRMGQLI